VSLSPTVSCTTRAVVSSRRRFGCGSAVRMESLAPEIATFEIRTMLVESAFLRSKLLSNDSTTCAQPTIDGYTERTKEIVAAWKSMDGKQGGAPAKLAVAVVTIVGLKERPVRFAAGPMQYGRSRPRPTRCSHRPKPTAIFPAHSPTMTLDHE
jgi:hypothetical protein